MNETEAIPNLSNLGNGWYPNLPPVTYSDLQNIISCLIANGCPRDPSIIAGRTTHLTGDLEYAPCEIIWKQDSKQISTDAVQTYYHPEVAYIDIAREFSLPFKMITCDKPSKVILIGVLNPLGESWPEKGSNCYRSNLNDRFIPGQSFTDISGTYLKKQAGYFFFSSSWWEKV